MAALKTIRQSQSPMIVHVAELIKADIKNGPRGFCWIASRAILGPTLEHVFLPPQMAWHVLLQLGDAITFIHSLRMAHDDITPDNVMLDHSRESFPGMPNAVLVDFGMLRCWLCKTVWHLIAQGEWDQDLDVVERLPQHNFLEAIKEE
ncbi:uncharacterized protein BDZ99DRAFT_577218 [Mytilinidion resinicola]|uniref:Protein kinase domain-containing protein n=1 Tax=Mytilinidion resinicola TaxID=574789 RepID=A0A6A6XZK8_9PEZI|nr:uncharacterized protein BDZ99DRAFT_577218 [Mytilinidion resinicola]KAF2802001.1 hypothetical protein BDZ99DRAFT_577218 [Mytilinidion resinicola]